MPESLTLTERFARIIATKAADGDPAMTALAQDLVIIFVYFVIAVLGAAVAEMFTSKRAGQSSAAFWSTHFPQKTELFHVRCDFAAKVFLGSVIALIAIAPETERQALTAGFGWAAALSAFMNVGQRPQRARRKETPTPETEPTLDTPQELKQESDEDRDNV